MTEMKAVQITKPGKFEIVERAIPVLGVKEIRIQLKAKDVCHSDFFTVEGNFPGIEFPGIPARISLKE